MNGPEDDTGTSTDDSGSYDSDSSGGSWGDSHDSGTASEQGNDGRDE